MNLRKDHCRNLPRQNDPRTRGMIGLGGHPPLVSTRAVEGRARARHGLPTNPGARSAKEMEYQEHALVASVSGARLLFVIILTTLGNGYLGSRIDEERSEMRYLV